MNALMAGPEYAKAVASYSNAFVNGAGRQKPGSAGFALWLLYDIYCAAWNRLLVLKKCSPWQMVMVSTAPVR